METRRDSRLQPFLESAPSIPPVFLDLSKKTIHAVVGQAVNLAAEPNLTEPASFQWFYGSASMLKEVPLKGQTNPTLGFVVKPGAVSGHFRCRVETQSGHVFLSGWFLVLVEAKRPQPRSIKFRAGRSSSSRY
jgi:hypothetical protein